MATGSNRYATRADTAVLAACVVVSLVVLALPAGLKDPIAGALRRTVLYPVLAVQRRTARSAEERERLTAVRAERDSLALETTLLPELRGENARLRALLALGGRLGHGFVTGEVLHQTGVADGLTMVLSVGRRDGVEPYSPVLTARGLLGLVRTVDARTSIALAWTHPDFRASAVVEGTAVYGIVRSQPGGRSGELMELVGVPYREQLLPGTRVVTSGLGGVFPRGIPLGTVQGTLTEATGWERTYVLRPAVHPAEAGHVVVISPARAADTVAAVFGSGLPGPDSVLVVSDSTGVRLLPAPPAPRRRPRPRLDTFPPAAEPRQQEPPGPPPASARRPAP